MGTTYNTLMGKKNSHNAPPKTSKNTIAHTQHKPEHSKTNGGRMATSLETSSPHTYNKQRYRTKTSY